MSSKINNRSDAEARIRLALQHCAVALAEVDGVATDIKEGMCKTLDGDAGVDANRLHNGVLGAGGNIRVGIGALELIADGLAKPSKATAPLLDGDKQEAA